MTQHTTIPIDVKKLRFKMEEHRAAARWIRVFLRDKSIRPILTEEERTTLESIVVRLDAEAEKIWEQVIIRTREQLLAERDQLIQPQLWRRRGGQNCEQEKGNQRGT